MLIETDPGEVARGGGWDASSCAWLGWDALLFTFFPAKDEAAETAIEGLICSSCLSTCCASGLVGGEGSTQCSASFSVFTSSSSVPVPLSASSEFYVHLLPLVEMLAAAAASSSCSRRRCRPHGTGRRLAPLPRRARLR